MVCLYFLVAKVSHKDIQGFLWNCAQIHSIRVSPLNSVPVTLFAFLPALESWVVFSLSLFVGGMVFSRLWSYTSRHVYWLNTQTRDVYMGSHPFCSWYRINREALQCGTLSMLVEEYVCFHQIWKREYFCIVRIPSQEVIFNAWVINYRYLSVSVSVRVCEYVVGSKFGVMIPKGGSRACHKFSHTEINCG